MVYTNKNEYIFNHKHVFLSQFLSLLKYFDKRTSNPSNLNNCYKLVQGFRITCLFTGQYHTKGYDTITDDI